MADCPVCAAAAATPLTHIGDYALYDCPACRLRFCDPMRSSDAQWYEQSAIYTERREREKAVAAFVLRQDWRYRSFFALRLNPGGTLLEVGCSSGMFLRLAAEQGYLVSGVDHDPSAVKNARELYGVTQVETASIEEFLARPRGDLVEVICLFDVLEHLDNPVRVIRELGGRLSPGGHLVCTVPSRERWPQWYNEHTDIPPHHLTLWTGAALERCFQRAGLETVAVLRSPLLGDHLLDQARARWKVLQRLDIVGKAARAIGNFIVMPIMAGVLSLRPGAGGFTLLGAARKPAG